MSEASTPDMKTALVRGGSAPGDTNVEEKTYPWSQFRQSCLCGCFNFVLQLVFLGSMGSFLFGFNMSLLNTATKTINSSFLQCGRDGDSWAKYNAMPEGELLR